MNDPHKFDRDRLRDDNKACSAAIEFLAARQDAPGTDSAVVRLALDYFQRQQREIVERLNGLPRPSV